MNLKPILTVFVFIDHFSPEKENTEAGYIAQAAKEAGVKHVIWSTLEDTRKWIPIEDNRMPTLKEKYNVPHYDGKGEANKLFTDAGVPTTFFQTSFYWENFIYFGMGPQKGPDGKYLLTLPMGDKKLPGIASEDIGKTAYAIFKRGNEFIGKTVSIAGGKLTGKQMAEGLSKALGKEIVYNPVSFDAYRSFGFPGADDLGNMFQFKHDFEDYYCGARDINFVKKLNPELKSFDQWAMENKSKIPMG